MESELPFVKMVAVVAMPGKERFYAAHGSQRREVVKGVSYWELL